MNKAYTRFSPLRSQFPAGFTPQELTVFSIEAAKAIIGEPEQSGRIVLLVMRRNESRFQSVQPLFPTRLAGTEPPRALSAF